MQKLTLIRRAAWAAVAVAVSAPTLPIPASSAYTSIALGLFAVVTVVVKYLWIPRKYWVWVPNWNAVGLAFVVPQVSMRRDNIGGC